MTFEEYQQGAALTAVYPKDIGLAYAALGLAGEAGECANKVKKVYRDHSGVLSEENRIKLEQEISDCLWYLAALATEAGSSLDSIAVYNLKKLNDRAQRGVLQGEGDNR